MPYFCSYCRGKHCAEHRIPENHNCPNLRIARPPSVAQTFTWSVEGYGSTPVSQSWWKRFSLSEIRQILMAWFALAFAFSVRYFGADGSGFTWPIMFGLLLTVVGLSFIGHELAHKFIAQRYNCWAEFRVWGWGLLMAIFVSLASFGNFLFAAPGAVYIVPRGWMGISRRQNGIISLSGPLVNIGLAALFALLGVFGGLSNQGTLVSRLAYTGLFVNLWLAAFNLIPLGLFDGQKVLAWRTLVWATVTVPLWALWAYLFILGA